MLKRIKKEILKIALGFPDVDQVVWGEQELLLQEQIQNSPSTYFWVNDVEVHATEKGENHLYPSYRLDISIKSKDNDLDSCEVIMWRFINILRSKNREGVFRFSLDSLRADQVLFFENGYNGWRFSLSVGETEAVVAPEDGFEARAVNALSLKPKAHADQVYLKVGEDEIAFAWDGADTKIALETARIKLEELGVASVIHGNMIYIMAEIDIVDEEQNHSWI